MFARVGGGEGEATFAVAALVDNSVVCVESFFDSNLQAETAVGFEEFGCGVVLLDFVVACEEGLLVLRRC